MKNALTLLVLSAVTGSTLFAQTNTNFISPVAQFKILRAAPDYSPSSPAVESVKTAILAKDQIDKNEAYTLQKIVEGQGGYSAWVSVAREIQNKCPYAAAVTKWADKNTDGWTEAMIADAPNIYIQAASLPTATQELKDQAWALVQNYPASGQFARQFFKSYRTTLPKAQQLEATQKQKDALLALPQRTDTQNAWLAEVSADLIALQLDQR